MAVRGCSGPFRAIRGRLGPFGAIRGGAVQGHSGLYEAVRGHLGPFRAGQFWARFRAVRGNSGSSLSLKSYAADDRQYQAWTWTTTFSVSAESQSNFTRVQGCSLVFAAVCYLLLFAPVTTLII